VAARNVAERFRGYSEVCVKGNESYRNYCCCERHMSMGDHLKKSPQIFNKDDFVMK
jgi:hypothetical protein